MHVCVSKGKCFISAGHSTRVTIGFETKTEPSLSTLKSIVSSDTVVSSASYTIVSGD